MKLNGVDFSQVFPFYLKRGNEQVDHPPTFSLKSDKSSAHGLFLLYKLYRLVHPEARASQWLFRVSQTVRAKLTFHRSAPNVLLMLPDRQEDDGESESDSVAPDDSVGSVDGPAVTAGWERKASGLAAWAIHRAADATILDRPHSAHTGANTCSNFCAR